ncbi:hypothetical protein H4Q26_017013 [Puccinia striiformis f. sp. tritici PST-130]|nr:hypothetical protein H4Q26_013423 [Puccinia striiformis f. sp. tritici PST-130]KAI9624150.1 hypothetical protein H4Q26_017013 [Puccinia striiformis f. sp. tritici PST-130]
MEAAYLKLINNPSKGGRTEGQISCFIWLHEWSNLIATLDETREFSFRRRLQVQGFLDNLVGLINPIQSHSGK